MSSKTSAPPKPARQNTSDFARVAGAALARITKAVYESTSADDALQVIVGELGAALSACRCWVSTFHGATNKRSSSTSHEYVARCSRKCRSRVTHQLTPAHLEQVLASEGPILIPNIIEPLNGSDDAAGIFISTAIPAEGRQHGLLNVACCTGDSLTTAEMDFVRTCALQAAVAIRQSDLQSEVRDSATHAALVNQIITSIRRSLDVAETLQVAVEELGKALGADRTYFRKRIGDQMIPVAEYLSDPGLSVKHVPTPASDFIGTYLLTSRRPLILDDVQAFRESRPELAAGVAMWKIDPPNLSQMVFPIIVNSEFWGVLSIAQARRLRKWTAAEIKLIEMITAQIEVAISHSYVFQEAKQSADRQGLISHIIHGVNQSNQLDEIFPVIVRELGDHLETDRVLISRLSSDGRQWVVEYAYGNGRVRRPHVTYPAEAFRSFTGFKDGNVMLCDDVDEDPRLEPYYLETYLRPFGVRSFLAARLHNKGESRLIITAMMTSRVRHWTDEEVEVMRAAIDQVSIAIQRAELFEQVLEGKHQWEATFDALTDGILIFDRQGMLVRINQAGAAFEGASTDELIGRKCCTLMQGSENEVCKVAQVMETGRPVTFDLVPGRLGRPVLVTISPLTDVHSSSQETTDGTQPAAEWTPIGTVCVVRDLSELRAAEAIAREQRNFLVKLIEHANDAIFAYSTDGKLIWFNEQLVTLSGYSRLELMSSDFRQFVTGEDKKIAVERFSRASIGEPQTFEINALRKDAEQRLLMMTFSPIYDEGGVSSVLTIARDITEDRVAAERAAQADKLRALGQLASGVAHNFNNILAAIVGHAQLIRRDCKEDVTMQGLEIIERAAMDGAETVKRIQAFGLQQNEAAGETVDLSKLVQDSTDLTRAKWSDEAHARGLRYEVELNLKDVPAVRGSASELREVFVNIIFNALDAMPQGGKLRISTDVLGPNVRVVFTDTGIGMSRQVIEHVFEPFFTTKGTSGMGLGLAVSYSIIERHGGRIEVASAPGRGTTFTVTLQMAEKPHSRVTSRFVRTTVSALVIDADEAASEELCRVLESAGYHSESAASAREGLAKLELGRFDLIFTDLSMPEMDGWTLANEIRRGWPSVKIVLLTGSGESTETVRHYRELVDEVFSKPVQAEHIKTILAGLLR